MSLKLTHRKGPSTPRELFIFEGREYYLKSPPQTNPPAKLPLLLVLHGGLGNAVSIANVTDFDALADVEGFYVAYPQGTEGDLETLKNKRTWNAGSCCGIAVADDIKDVLFLSGLIDEIASKNPINIRRVYATGFSNGGMMAARLAASIPNKIAAIASVSGPLAVDVVGAAKDVPIMHIHGDADTKVPYDGGVGDGFGSTYHKSIPETVGLWAASRGEVSTTTEDMGVGFEFTTHDYSQGSPIEVFKIFGGGHAWPGGIGTDGVGEDEGDSPLVATPVVWDFLVQFDLDEE